MADVFTLSGGFTVVPTADPASGDPALSVVLAESLQLSAKTVATYALTADSPVSVDFGGVTNAGVVSIRAVGGKVRARLTSADGSTQAVPIDPLGVFLCREVPVTAIDLTRVAGQDTNVVVFLGEE